jgi:hypothetical protein
MRGFSDQLGEEERDEREGEEVSGEGGEEEDGEEVGDEGENGLW